MTVTARNGPKLQNVGKSSILVTYKLVVKSEDKKVLVKSLVGDKEKIFV